MKNKKWAFIIQSNQVPVRELYISDFCVIYPFWRVGTSDADNAIEMGSTKSFGSVWCSYILIHPSHWVTFKIFWDQTMKISERQPPVTYIRGTFSCSILTIHCSVLYCHHVRVILDWSKSSVQGCTNIMRPLGCKMNTKNRGQNHGQKPPQNPFFDCKFYSATNCIVHINQVPAFLLYILIDVAI
jgi:hypothetical protein